MKSIPLQSARSLLEKYVQAKDGNRPELIHEAFAPDALLTFSINTDTINFPLRAEGAESIATTLVSEFAKVFDRCRTYYVVDALAVTGDTLEIPWFVAMRETAAHTMRAGKGFYRWRFSKANDGAYRVAALHIHIERMDSVADAGAVSLGALQGVLHYPWLAVDTLKQGIERLVAGQPALSFMESFSVPVPLPGCNVRRPCL